MSKIRVYHLYDECWGVHYHLRLGGTATGFNRWCKRAVGTTATAGSDSTGFCQTGKSGYGLWVSDWDGSPEAVGLLAHEVFHAAHFTLRDRGMELSDQSDEAWAYLMGSLMARFLTVIEGI